MKFDVRIFNESNTKDQKVIEVEQPDQTNLAYSPEIPSGWAFQNAKEKPSK